MSEQLGSLRQAAMTLLAAALAGAVLKAVRTRLDGLELDRPTSQPASARSPTGDSVAAVEIMRSRPQRSRLGNSFAKSRLVM
jgi:hypothetical protein